MLEIMEPKKLFKTANEFSLHIEHLAIEEGIPCYNALLNYCEEQDLDPSDIAKSVSKQLKDKLEVEFANLGLLKKIPSLFDE